jgi:hypothetical protein
MYMEQPQWSWCRNCSSFFFSGHATQGVCPHGGVHDKTGSGAYAVIMNPPPLIGTLGGLAGQAGWRHCSNCEGMFWPQSGTSGGRCPAGTPGGAHDGAASAVYAIDFSGAILEYDRWHYQDGWSWCTNCQGLF